MYYLVLKVCDTMHCYAGCSGGAENAGVENAGVENAGATKYGKPSEIIL